MSCCNIKLGFKSVVTTLLVEARLVSVFVNYRGTSLMRKHPPQAAAVIQGELDNKYLSAQTTGSLDIHGYVALTVLYMWL